MKKQFLFNCWFILLLVSFMQVKAQNLSNRGIDFWVGYGHHQFMESGGSNSQEMVLYLSAEQAANVTVKIEGTTWVRNYAVPANSVIASEYIPKAGSVDARLISLPCSFVPPGTACGGEGVFSNKGIHITSDVPIVAYAHIFGSASSGATMLMPVESWGNAYITLNSKQSYAANCFSWAYVIAQKDNTVVEITPTALTRSGKPANVTFSVTLNRGQIYQLMAGPESGSDKPDLSGTKFKSVSNTTGECTPIAVFAGSSRTANPGACGSGGGDNDNQQCFPTQAWGKRYLTAPTSNSVTASSPMINIYKIARKDATTIVKRNGVAIPLSSFVNNVYTFETNTADYIIADKPIMLAQFMTGGSSCQGGGGVGDPEMMYLSPIEQGIKRVGFYRNNREGITVNYLTLVIPTAGVSSLRIDGSAAFSHSYLHPNLPGYSVVVKRWSSAQAQAVAQSDSAFTAVTYGLGSVESYGYNAGTLINNLSAVGSIFNSSDSSGTVSQHPFTCTKTPVKLSVLLGYPTPPTKLIWRLSQVGGGLLPNTDVIDNSPTPVDTIIYNGIRYLKFELPGTYTFQDTGYFKIPILATHITVENCNNTEEVYYYITVKGRPNFDFTISSTGCVLDTVYFTAPAISTNGFALNKWTWTFPDLSTSNTQNTSKLFLTPGIKNVNLKVISTEGCVGDTTKPVSISAAPISGFKVSANPVCYGIPITFTDSSTYTGAAPIGSAYWDFGDGTIQTVNNINPVTHTYTTTGTFWVRHSISMGSSCQGDTAGRSITVSTPPITTFNIPAGCLPANGLVQFNSTAYSPDGLPIANHLWNFGDPASGVNNTSNLPNPTHTYANSGTYTLTYSAATANGCTKDTTVIATFNFIPALNYPVLTAVCENAVAPINIATATVTNGGIGTGVYSGPGTSASGSFNPAIAGAGTHTIKYIFTATGNCIDSITQTILVYPKPSAAFAIVGAGCLPPSGLVNFTYTGTAIAGQTYLWDFGHPTSGVNNSSTLQNPSHNYPTGPFTIKLTVTTTNGCKVDSIVTNTFNVKPALAYPALAAVCQSVIGTVSVATATVTNGATGTGVYSGSGTTAAGAFSPSIAGAGTHTIKYIFTASGNCVDSITQTILVYPKPAALFTYPTVACLPTTGLAAFTYTGSMSASQTYAWNFGDITSGANNISSLQNPSHNYTNTGLYTVKVVVTNSNGCVDSSIINKTFSVTPALNYPALAAVCQSVVGTINVATATVTNAVTGTGIYSGPGVDAAGNFSPSIAGAGTHTITYTFTSTGNCVTTITQTIKVNPKPVSTFSINNSICLGQQALVTDNSTISIGSIVSWKWDFADGDIQPKNNNAAFNKLYGNFGNYIVKLITTSLDGCISDTAKRTIIVNAIPVAAFAMPASVCMPGGNASFINNSTVADGTSLTYSWSFGDGSPAATTSNANHVFAAIGNYTINLKATSSGGCFKDSSQQFNAFFVKPIAKFIVTPSVLCQGNDNVFQDQSTAANSSIKNRLWIFGDGSTSTAINPVKKYSNPGVYKVKLVVINNENCISDTFSSTITVYLQPVIDAGPNYVVAQGTIVRFFPIVNDSTVTSFLWSPAALLSNPTALRPTYLANADQNFTLTATVAGFCKATDLVSVKILRPVICPNAFSPNGDGVNDTWVLENLSDYPDAQVEVYNRYGQIVFTSYGYNKAWDGTYNGKPLPVATYYYIIQLNSGFKPLNGSITIIR